MKKNFMMTVSALLFMAATMMPTKAYSQWNVDENYSTLVSFPADADQFYASSPCFARTDDGKLWVSYKIWEEEGVHTFVELFDKDLNRMFEQPVRLNAYLTPDWWADNGMAVTSDGSVVVALADSRTEQANMTEEELEDPWPESFQPAIYKVNQKGELVWGNDGITCEKFQNAPFSDIMVIGDDIFWQVINLDDWTYEELPYLMRLDNDGNMGYDDFKNIYGQIAPSINGDFLTVTSGSTMMRYDRDCNPVWAEPVNFDSFSPSGMDTKPYQIVTDGKGGAAVAFMRDMGEFSHNSRVQYVNGNGELGFGAEALDVYAPEEFDHKNPKIGINMDTEEIAVSFVSKYDNKDFAECMNKFSLTGEKLWGEKGKQIVKKNAPAEFAYLNIATSRVGADEWISFYIDQSGNADESLVIVRYDKDANVVWEKHIGKGLNIWDTKVFVDENVSYIYWRDETQDRGIHALRIFNDGTFGVPSGIEEVDDCNVHAQSYYSIDGMRTDDNHKGITIVKYSDGTTRKIVK